MEGRPKPVESDVELLQRFLQERASQNPAAENTFAILYRRYNKAIFTAAIKILKDQDKAHACMLFAYRQLYIHAEKMDRPVKSWLYTVAIRDARRQKRRKQLPTVNMHEMEEAGNPPVLPDYYSIEQRIEQKETQDKIRRAISLIPDFETRHSMFLKGVRGMDVADIALYLEKKPSAIQHRIKMGMQYVRQSMLADEYVRTHPLEHATDSLAVKFLFRVKRRFPQRFSAAIQEIPGDIQRNVAQLFYEERIKRTEITETFGYGREQTWDNIYLAASQLISILQMHDVSERFMPKDMAYWHEHHLDVLWEVTHELVEKQRDIFIACVFNRQSIVEYAMEHEEKYRSVSSRLHRARENVRAKITRIMESKKAS